MRRSGPYGLPGKGDLFGAVALFSHGPHSATAVAVEHVILLAIHAPRLEEIVRTNPERAWQRMTISAAKR
jgi:CRP-like cAMP-binding protein